jgi:hypothetical protein
MQRALITGNTHMFPVHGAIPSGHQVNTHGAKSKGRLLQDGSGNYYYEHENEEDYVYGREAPPRYPWERPPPNPDAGIIEDFMVEWNMIWGTVGYILQTWIDLPRTL